MFQTEGIQGLSLLPPCKSNLKYTMRANDVANMYINAIKLNMYLEDPTEHGGRKDGSAEWEENYFPVNLDDVFTNYENLEKISANLVTVNSK